MQFRIKLPKTLDQSSQRTRLPGRVHHQHHRDAQQLGQIRAGSGIGGRVAAVKQAHGPFHHGQIGRWGGQGGIAQEKLPDGLTLTRSQDVLGRPAGISVAGGGDPGQPYAVEYGYDAYGRFGSVTSSVSSVSSVVNYSYLPGSDLLTGYSTPGSANRDTSHPRRDDGRS